MSWQQWKYTYQKELEHIAGYEEKFVDLVLSQIPEIDPDDVVPQYHFLDSRGKNRYIDFMILNKRKGYCLPIELDGFAKMVGAEYNGGYEKFNDFLERQNAIINQFGLVLRYSNKTMLNDSPKIVRELQDTLKKQRMSLSTREIKERHTAQMVQDYEQRIKELQMKVKKVNQPTLEPEEMLAQIKATRIKLELLNQSLDESVTHDESVVVDKVKEDEEDSETSRVGGIVILILIFLAVGWFILDSNARKNTNVPIESVDTTPVAVANTEITETVSNPFNESSENVVVTQESKPKANEKVNEKPKVVDKPVAKEKPVEASKPKYIVGQVQEVCGRVAKVKEFAKGTYLNLGKPFPNEDITLVMWDMYELSDYRGKRVCVNRTVEEHKGRLQVHVNSIDSLY